MKQKHNIFLMYLFRGSYQNISWCRFEKRKGARQVRERGQDLGYALLSGSISSPPQISLPCPWTPSIYLSRQEPGSSMKGAQSCWLLQIDSSGALFVVDHFTPGEGNCYGHNWHIRLWRNQYIVLNKLHIRAEQMCFCLLVVPPGK